mmetsp:Transcript_43837/g.85773  ORF Transcript_43837/g.85773 Transcript_43837/m.85773 type:complete len:113 (+) Transcript_43837:1636-1974(+)
MCLLIRELQVRQKKKIVERSLEASPFDARDHHKDPFSVRNLQRAWNKTGLDEMNEFRSEVNSRAMTPAVPENHRLTLSGTVTPLEGGVPPSFMFEASGPASREVSIAGTPEP